MRWTIVVVLLLANVLYFGWELDKESGMIIRNSAMSLKIPPHARRLTLLGELDSPPSLRQVDMVPDGSAEVISSLTAEQAGDERNSNTNTSGDLVSQLPDISIAELEARSELSSCFSFGPLPDEIQANGLNDWFRSRGVSTNVRYKEDKARQLFWIYLAPRETKQDAIATIRELNEKGVSDYRLINRGNLQHAISLGLLSSQAAVNDRLRELNKKGYKPIVVPYANVQRIYWVDVQLQGKADFLEQVFKGYPAKYNSIPVKCGDIAMSSLTP